MDLILASTSPYRRDLLQRLQIPFRCLPQDADETPLAEETPQQLVERLALAKATSISTLNTDSLVIGSDQVATLDGRIMGKPGHHDAAVAQLRACSGKEVQFYTGLAVVCESTGFRQVHVEPFTVHFRQLSNTAIENYLKREQPYDCAGSFKCEGLGIVLFARLVGDDPTSLEGLPLIALTNILAAAGLGVLN